MGQEVGDRAMKSYQGLVNQLLIARRSLSLLPTPGRLTDTKA